MPANLFDTDTAPAPGPYLDATAWVSLCGTYRYDLTRTWDRDKPRVLWVMLNPSTADGAQDDPTIRRCVGFSKSWGYGGLVVVNLFALRATDPRELYKAADPIGPQCSAAIIHRAIECPLRIAAWGTHGAFRGRGDAIRQLLGKLGQPLNHLGQTRDGHPRHPLYLRGDVQPQPFYGGSS